MLIIIIINHILSKAEKKNDLKLKYGIKPSLRADIS